MDFQWILTWSLDCQKSLPVLVAVGVDEIPLLVLASCQSWDPMPVHRIRQHPSLQGTAHPLSLVALQHAGQCGAWRGDGNRCRICRRTTFRTEHCLYVYTKGAFPGVCDASSCYLLAGFLTSTYFLGFWPASTKSFEAPGEETSAVVATRSCLLFRRALT